MKGKRSPSRGAKKKKKISRAELRINLIIAGGIVLISAMLFLGRVVFDSSKQVPAEKLSERSSTLVEPTESPQPQSPVPAVVDPIPNSSASGVAIAVEPRPDPLNAVPEKVTQFSQPVSPEIVNKHILKAPSVNKPVRKPDSSAGAAIIAQTSSPKPIKPIPPKRHGTIIFVFDDAGYNLNQLEPFLKLPFPCTIAVLPGLRYSSEVARRVRAAGKEAILHQPMQASNLKMDPGPGAIKKGMTQDQIRDIVRKNLAEVWPVVGLNNHEGSLITTDQSAMEAVFDVARAKGIYFLDSRTNAKTVSSGIARERGMTIWERAVFLDNTQDRAAIIEALNNGLTIADKKGTAIMIGHIWSNQLAGILSEMYPELVSQGYSLSTIAKIAISDDFDERGLFE